MLLSCIVPRHAHTQRHAFWQRHRFVGAEVLAVKMGSELNHSIARIWDKAGVARCLPAILTQSRTATNRGRLSLAD